MEVDDGLLEEVREAKVIQNQAARHKVAVAAEQVVVVDHMAEVELAQWLAEAEGVEAVGVELAQS